MEIGSVPCWSRPRGAWLLSAVLLLAAAQAGAQVRLAAVFSDHMVLQRNVELPVWGWAAPGEKVTVSFGAASATAVAAADGKWLARLPKLEASAEPRELVATASNKVTLTDVLVGDVWLGSGQSNMEMALRDVQDGEALVAAAGQPNIRLFTVPRFERNQKVEDVVGGKWATCTAQSARDFSALLYLFAREIQPEAGVPIGLIHSSVGGTRIELWTAPEGFALAPEYANSIEQIDGAERNFRETLPEKFAPMEAWMAASKKALAEGAPIPVMPEWPQHGNPSVATLYHGMIYPLVPFALRGVIWYQGEWNGGEDEVYARRMQALIGGWRAAWNAPELPFYYVQLARMPEEDSLPWKGDGLSPTRDAQRRSLAIPHTGMAVIIDLEGDRGWHPKNKQDVAKRLALWALRNEYGRSNLVISGPLYESIAIEGAKVRVRFTSTGGGLVVGAKSGIEPMALTPNEPLRNFALAGEDKVWVNATAVIDGTDVLVSAPQVAHPVAVRYAHCQDPKGCNLFNKEALPASPFRSDNW